MATEDETQAVEWPAIDQGITPAPREASDRDNGDTSPPVQAVDSPGPFSGSSVVDLFKQEQEELASTKSVMIPVKGYERTGLQVRYKMPGSGKELEIISTKVNRQYKDTYSRNLYTGIDTMIYLCDGLFVQLEDMPEPVDLDPENLGEPCMFDSTLAEMLGMDVSNDDTTARKVVLKLFAGNELAVMTHAFDLNRWLQNTKADLNLEVWQVGE